ncbi:hypothetical protein A1O1_02421 [Capronia coronata CBS 617.96]|uniref:Velvet domain-containing protein n=1 Tax=Capronia coronata CBS 617.96 TaxID=1182541 RepID=W9YNA6_9EURO|nr:uncharacterized protein A1O1_02421 [Capronia coronata CBS 617.96]EXJ94028.1 hypothetical protein A1O1_02421 [Capronia coronata CBS 617.96]
MELAIAPPSKVAAGVSLHLPVVVTFTTAAALEEGTLEHESYALPDLSGVWAFVSLTTPDMQQSLAPPRTDLLRGRTADSIHPVHQDQEGDRPTLAYATFRELMITQPGRYRIKINIIDMNTLFADNSPQAAATVLPSIHSPVFDVVEEQDHAICGKQSFALHQGRR